MSETTPEITSAGAPVQPTAATVARSAGDPKHREKRRKLARNARHALVGLAIAGATAAAVLALRPSPVPVDLSTAVRGPLATVINESGVTRVVDRYVVSAPLAGSLSRSNLEPGDSVSEGDVLAEIAPALSPLLDERTRAEAEARLGAAVSALGQTRAQVARATVARELAEQALARSRKLSASGSLPAEALERAEFEARLREEERASADFASRVASQEVRIARVALGRDQGKGSASRHIDVLAPVSGRVLRVYQESAGVVPSSAPLVEIGDPAALEVVVDLLTTDAVQVRIGTPVVIGGWGGPHPLAGRVRRIEPAAFTRPSALGVDEQRVNVVVTLTDPRERWEALGDGFRVETRLVLWESKSVLKVPHGAVFRRGDSWATYRVDDERAKLVPISVGHWGESEVEILSGLAEGAKVAVYPGDRVKDGARVEPR